MKLNTTYWKAPLYYRLQKKNIEEIQENINPYGEKEIYETRETKSNTKRVNGRCSFIEYCWSFIMDKIILISYEKNRNLTSRQTSKELKWTGYQKTKKRKLWPPGTPEKKKRTESVTGHHFLKKKEKKTDKKGGILSHVHEDVAGLKSWTRSRIWKCERDFSNIIV